MGFLLFMLGSLFGGTVGAFAMAICSVSKGVEREK